MLGGTTPRRLLALAVMVSALVLALGALSAFASAPPGPWDGVNPFKCVIQDAGKGTTVPDPGADPYCVNFDKTGQNVTELGLIDFLTKEPARVAAAVPKCFYYQQDHWRGSLIQSDQRTVIYEFSGHYFFNKATGDGGAWVTGFSIAGRTFDPRTLPGFPSQYDKYFGPGQGGFITHNDIPADPSCAAAAKQPPGPYASPPRKPPHKPVSCIAAGGAVTRHGAGRFRLGAAGRGVHRYCVASGGALVTEARAGRVVLVLTTSRSFAARHGIRVSERLPRDRDQAQLRLDGAHVLIVSRARGRAVIAGVRRGRVAWLASYDSRALRSRRALATALRRAV